MQNLRSHFLMFCTPTWPSVSSRGCKPRIMSSVNSVLQSHWFCLSLRDMKELSLLLRVEVKDGAYYCYCAYALRISRYSGFLWVVLIKGLFTWRRVDPPWWDRNIACVYMQCYHPGVPGNVFFKKNCRQAFSWSLHVAFVFALVIAPFQTGEMNSAKKSPRSYPRAIMLCRLVFGTLLRVTRADLG